MNAKFIEHVESLKSLLDSFSNPSIMKERIEKIESLLAPPSKAPAIKASRADVISEATFMIKNKERINKAVGPEKYMEVFSKAVKFLEKNPPERKKKKKKSTNPFLGSVIEVTLGNTVDAYRYSVPTAGYFQVAPPWRGYTIPSVTFETPRVTPHDAYAASQEAEPQQQQRAEMALRAERLAMAAMIAPPQPAIPPTEAPLVPTPSAYQGMQTLMTTLDELGYSYGNEYSHESITTIVGINETGDGENR